jgi:hypothetical protein
MKSKLLILGLIALMLASGLVLVSCSKCPGTDGKGKDAAKCSVNYSSASSSYGQCTDLCLSDQILSDLKAGGNYKSSYSCNCD